MSAIEKCAEMLRREAGSLKACHTLDGDWRGDPAEADYHEMIALADAAIAERDELLEALKEMVRTFAKNHAPAVDVARAAIARATGEQP